ncbi:MAG TPA: outer membrane protein assembly factor BamD [Flavobacteriaceae bacterium]|nr:outer membrane protein assembly factor BamD [Flavobacteriaceae bacterium]
MRNLLYISVLMFLVSACGPYQKVLKNDEIKPKYDLATEYYKEGLESGKKYKFKRAIRLLEQIAPQYRGKPQGEPIAYSIADSYYQLGDFFNAGYQFERFTKAYPNSDKKEEAAFKEAKSYYEISPKYTLDQHDTEKALVKLQHYIWEFTSGEHVSEANTLVSELRDKLEKKKFKIAELYYHQDDYRSAIAAMEVFIDENPGSAYREKAYFYKMDAQYTLATNSVKSLMEERLTKTKKYSEDYLKYFPEGEFYQQAKDVEEDVTKRLKEFN